jgi:hypothetical protein
MWIVVTPEGAAAGVPLPGAAPELPHHTHAAQRDPWALGRGSKAQTRAHRTAFIHQCTTVIAFCNRQQPGEQRRPAATHAENRITVTRKFSPVTLQVSKRLRVPKCATQSRRDLAQNRSYLEN